ncbi:hypothetical protein PFICI_02886 [Pestalotiopsis fici W106-1]|uniref:Uncharacterized protein n=1 Tax=Pestalotiopsis fici (strain W106-1 / CGMCC3.15140) TaxID=1229662 RepID=W3XI00_PESFW|nr:uncharacterized protein PFICI_02886 [Pestalotiopsis fici W106-1]ETS84861.1 hypothetical protein PFICI_02886 [Pestalotiopsis fici W106-1]
MQFSIFTSVVVVGLAAFVQANPVAVSPRDVGNQLVKDASAVVMELAAVAGDAARQMVQTK